MMNLGRYMAVARRLAKDCDHHYADVPLGEWGRAFFHFHVDHAARDEIEYLRATLKDGYDAHLWRTRYPNDVDPQLGPKHKGEWPHRRMDDIREEAAANVTQIKTRKKGQ